MSLLSKATKATSNVLLLPLRVAFPKTVIEQRKHYKVKKKETPYCPSCGMEHLVLRKTSDTLEGEDLGDDSEVNYTWDCSSCKLSIEVADPSISTLKQWIAENGKEIYLNSPYYQHKQIGDLDEIVERNIRKRVLTARLFLVVSLIFAVIFLYACITTNFFFALNSFLMGFCIFFLGVVNGYRAWQIKTDSLYADNPKEQFHSWLANYQWFKYPSHETVSEEA
jgi:transcription elongation factor Elf1